MEIPRRGERRLLTTMPDVKPDALITGLSSDSLRTLALIMEDIAADNEAEASDEFIAGYLAGAETLREYADRLESVPTDGPPGAHA